MGTRWRWSTYFNDRWLSDSKVGLGGEAAPGSSKAAAPRVEERLGELRKAHRAIESGAATPDPLFNIALNKAKETCEIIESAQGSAFNDPNGGIKNPLISKTKGWAFRP